MTSPEPTASNPDAVDLVLALVADREPLAAPPDVDWARFVRLLERHGIQGLAMAAHRSSPFLPGAVAELLEEAHVRTALHTTLTVEAGVRARHALGEAGIPALLFKGAALVEGGLYQDPGARAMGDADLLVPPEDADGAVAALREAGFEPWSPWDSASVGWLDSASLSDLRAPEGVEVSLDLHWRLGYERLRYGPSRRSGIVWEGVEPEEGRPVDSIHLIVLLEHLLKHLHVTSHLRGICDAVRLCDSVEDWGSVWSHLRERPTGRGSALLLDVLRVRLGAPVPAEIARLAEAGWWREVGRRVLDPRRLVTGVAGASGPAVDREAGGGEEIGDPRGPGRVGGLLRRWAVLGSPRLALREAVHTTLPEKGWLRARYGAPAASRLRLLLRYWADVGRWVSGGGSSPVSPNQEP